MEYSIFATFFIFFTLQLQTSVQAQTKIFHQKWTYEFEKRISRWYRTILFENDKSGQLGMKHF
jgi:hypothetical protein